MGGKNVKARNMVELILQCGALFFLLFYPGSDYHFRSSIFINPFIYFRVVRLGLGGATFTAVAVFVQTIGIALFVLACAGMVLFIIQYIDKVKCYNLRPCVILSIVELGLFILRIIMYTSFSHYFLLGFLIALVILSAVGYYRTNPKMGIQEMGAYFKRAGENTKTDSTHPVIQESADDLQKYKNLLDEGAITQEEFDVKKKQILNL